MANTELVKPDIFNDRQSKPSYSDKGRLGAIAKNSTLSQLHLNWTVDLILTNQKSFRKCLLCVFGHSVNIKIFSLLKRPRR